MEGKTADQFSSLDEVEQFVELLQMELQDVTAKGLEMLATRRKLEKEIMRLNGLAISMYKNERKKEKQ